MSRYLGSLLLLTVIANTPWIAHANPESIPNVTAIIDPTQPAQVLKSVSQASTPKAKISAFDVQMISYNPQGGSFVVIDGKRFAEGDAFDETSIKKIEKTKVILSNPERKPLILDYATLSIKQNGGSKP